MEGGIIEVNSIFWKCKICAGGGFGVGLGITHFRKMFLAYAGTSKRHRVFMLANMKVCQITSAYEWYYHGILWSILSLVSTTGEKQRGGICKALLDKEKEYARKLVNETTVNKVVEAVTSDISNKIAEKVFGKFSDNVYKVYCGELKKIKKTEGMGACPVDVYIYDSQGNLCGSIVDDELQGVNDDIFLCVIGDKKYFTLSGDDYNVKFVGNGTGKMDYTVSEYEDDILLRTLTYSSIPLTKGKAYYGAVPYTQMQASAVYNPVDMDDLTEIEAASDTKPGIGNNPGGGTKPEPDSSQGGGTKPEPDSSQGNSGNSGGSSGGNSGSYYPSYPSSPSVPGSSTTARPQEPASSQPQEPDFSTQQPQEPDSSSQQPQEPDTGAGKPNVPDTSAYQKGDFITDAASKAIFEITKLPDKKGDGGTVSYLRPVDKKAASITVPNTVTLNGLPYKVTAVAAKAFQGNANMKKAVIGKYVLKLGANSFYNCKKLTTVVLGSGLTWIGKKAFYQCSALTKITIPVKVFAIGSKAFYGCRKLKSVTIKTAKLTSKNVGSKAFAKTSSKIKVKVPGKVSKRYQKLLPAKGMKQIVFSK